MRAEEGSRRGVGASQEMERRERKRKKKVFLLPVKAKRQNKETNKPKTPLSFCHARDKNKETKQTKSNLQKSRGKESILLHWLCLGQYMEEAETFAVVSTQEVGDL